MSFSIVWDVQATEAAREFHKDDQVGLAQVFRAVGLLAEDARPDGTTEYGSPNLRRMHVDRHRVLYEIIPDTRTIVIIHVGRLS